LGWLSIPPSVLVFIVLGAHWAGVVGQSQKASEQDVLKATHAECEACITHISDKWLSYNRALKFKPDIPLSDIIEGFSIPMHEFVSKTYPLIYAAGPALFWMVIFRGIQQTRIPSLEAVNHAITELDAKLRGGSRK
jgi:hypothetical protein